MRITARRFERLCFGALLSAAALGGCKHKDQDKDNAPAHVDTTGSAAMSGSGSSSGSGSAVTEQAAPKTPAATPEAKLRRYNECWAAFNAGKLDTFVDCFAPDGVREQVDSIPDLVAQGPDKILEMAKAQRAAFPDLKVTPQVVVISGSDIVAILHVTGTNTAVAGGMRATGKKLGVFEAEVAVLGDDGKFATDSFYVDQPTMFHQLGLLVNDSSPNAIEKHLGEVETLTSLNDAHEQANKAVVQKDLDAVNKKDAKAIEAIAADDIKFTFHGEKQKIENKKAYMKWVKEYLAATTNSKLDVKGMWAAGDYVVVSDAFTGIPSDKKPAAADGAEADDRRLDIHVVQFFRVVDGKIKQHHFFANRLKSAVQLGMVDPDQLMQALAAAGEVKETKKK